MSKLSPELGTFFEKMADDLKAHPGEKITTNTARATLQENQRSEFTVRGFTLIQDEPESAFGTAKGPTPTDLLIPSVALCENVIFARNAAIARLSIDSLQTTCFRDLEPEGTLRNRWGRILLQGDQGGNENTDQRRGPRRHQCREADPPALPDLRDPEEGTSVILQTRRQRRRSPSVLRQ
jgi:hypothetical protein